MKQQAWKGWIFGGGLALFTLAGIGFYIMTSREVQAAETIPVYKEATVKRGEIQIDFEADGRAAFSLLNLRFTESGTLGALPVAVGEDVKQNGLLAELDDSEHQRKIDDARDAYALAVLQHEKTVLQYEEALKAEAARIDVLVFQAEESTRQNESLMQAAEAFSRLELENAAASQAKAETELLTAQNAYAQLRNGDPDIALASFAVAQAEKAISEAEGALADTKLTAPVPGKIVKISAQTGETVSSSEDFLTLALSDEPDILSLVSELDVASIELGQAVEIEFEAIGDETAAGHVSSIEPLAERDSNGLVNYTVHLSLDEANPRILDGMTCTVSYILREKKNILILPNAAIRMVGTQQVIEVRDESGNVEEKAVTTGLTDGLNVEVVSGASAGEIVLIRTK